MKSRKSSDHKVITLRKAIACKTVKAVSCATHDAAVDSRHLAFIYSKTFA